MRTTRHVRTRGVAWLAAVGTVASLLVVGAVPAVGDRVPAAAETSRLSGDSRYETAVAIAAAAFPDGGEYVYVARADNFPDALAGGGLTNGPILLVPPTGAVPSSVLDEIDRQDPSAVIALGGPSAVSDEVLAQVAAGRQAGRVQGDDRYETAVKIARIAYSGGATTVYIARADNFPDALAGGALTDGPILLVPQSGPVPQVVKDAIADFAPTQVVALGGPGAVADSVLAEAAGGRSTSRLSGDDRYETAVAISMAAFPDGAGTVYVARADTFPDALAGGVLTDGPILLVPPSGSVPQVVKDEIARLTPRSVVALGGDQAIARATLEDAAAAAPDGAIRPGTILFTVRDGSRSQVLAVEPDGSNLRVAIDCETSSCGELDWEAGGRALLLDEDEVGFHRAEGEPLTTTLIRTRSTRVVPWEFDAHDVVVDRPAFANFWRVDGGQGFGTSYLTGSGGTTTSGGPFRRPPSFQTISTSPARSDCTPVMLHLLEDESLEIVGCPPGESAGWESVPAHAQRRAGAAVIGAALIPDGSGDIVITDEIGGEGRVRILPLSGGEVVADGLDVTSTPYVMPDHQTIVVLAQVSGTTRLVAVDRASGDIDVLVGDTLTGATDRRISSDASGTFIAWTTGVDIRVLDTRDGSVAVVSLPGSATVVGGPAVRP